MLTLLLWNICSCSLWKRLKYSNMVSSWNIRRVGHHNGFDLHLGWGSISPTIAHLSPHQHNWFGQAFHIEVVRNIHSGRACHPRRQQLFRAPTLFDEHVSDICQPDEVTFFADHQRWLQCSKCTYLCTPHTFSFLTELIFPAEGDRHFSGQNRS